MRLLSISMTLANTVSVELILNNGNRIRTVVWDEQSKTCIMMTIANTTVLTLIQDNGDRTQYSSVGRA